MNHVKMTSPCLQGLSPFLLSNSSTTVFYSQTYRGITRRNYHIDTNAQEEEIRYQQTEVFFMVVKDVDSAALAQMPKGEKLPIQHHATLGFPVNHIAPISKPLH